MATINIKTGDTAPSVEATLADDDGAVDLTGATVRFVVGRQGETPIVNGAATLVNAVSGQVSYAWQPADTATPGVYQAEWEITWSDGGVQTVPADGYDTVTILADLG